METLIIKQAFIITCIVLAIWCCMLEGMIFGKVREINMPEWMDGAVYDCCVCMEFWYGTALYWLIFHDSIINWALVVVSGMGMATIFVKIKKN